MAKDGMNYSPDMGKMEKVVEAGEFVFSASHFNHGHINGQIEGLVRAGGTLKSIYHSDTTAAEFQKIVAKYPHVKVVSDFKEILDDPEVKLVTSAAIPNKRCEIGLAVMDSGKDYLTDKSPFTTLDQLEQARQKVKSTGQKYMVCYSERLCNESAWHAGELIKNGAIGKVLQVTNLAPHNLAAASRPDWFFNKECFGGVLTDIGSHQFEQFLYYTGATDGEVSFSRVKNFENQNYSGFEDFGEANITLNTGASGYCRIDWFNPEASRTWGDGRTFILGTEGYIEVRKYIDVARGEGDRLFLVNQQEELEIECRGKVGFPYFGQLILDCLNRTENAMTQEHAFKAAELSMKAQLLADEVAYGNQ